MSIDGIVGAGGGHGGGCSPPKLDVGGSIRILPQFILKKNNKKMYLKETNSLKKNKKKEKKSKISCFQSVFVTNIVEVSKKFILRTYN